MSHALQAIPTEYGLGVLTGTLKKTATRYALLGAVTHDAAEIKPFHSDSIESAYFDENGVLIFQLDLPTAIDFKEYLHQIVILDESDKVVIECNSPKIALAKGIGGMVTLKTAVKGEAGEVVFKSGDYVTEEELQKVYLPPVLAAKEDKSNAATNADIDNESTALKHIKLPQLWRVLASASLIDKLWLKFAAKIYPVGAPIPWFTDTAPSGFAIMKGQAFDTDTYPELAKVWSNGVIPDMRGCGAIGKEESEAVGAYEEGQVKRHGHSGTTTSSTNLGSKTSNVAGNHSHVLRTTTSSYTGSHAPGWYSDHNYVPRGLKSGSPVNRITGSSSAAPQNAGSHSHTITVGSHAHTIAIALFGESKNTINHRKVNWIVRLA